MAKNQSTYTLKIDAELGNLQSIVTDAKKKLEGLMASPNAPKGIEKDFEKISNLLSEISNKAGKELDLKGFAKVGKDISSVEDNFSAILRLLGDFKNLSGDIQFSFLKPDEQKKVQDITKALEDYGKAAEEAAKKLKSLEAARSTNDKNRNKVDKAQKKVDDLTSQKKTKTAKLQGVEKKLDAAKSAPKMNPQDIAKYEAQIISLKTELGELDKALNGAQTELADTSKTYKTSSAALDTLQKSFNDLNDNTIKNLSNQITKLGGSLDGLDGKEPAEQAKILADRLEELKQKTLATGEQVFKNLQEEIQGVGPVAKSAAEEIKGATDAIGQMDEVAAQRDAFEKRIKSFLGLQGAAQLLRAAFRDAIQTVTELDATMTEMAVVTDLGVGDYWDQLPEYSKQASELGVSINSAYKAATLYYQQGLKGNEVTRISAETLKMARIAGLSAEDATNKMTAALRGFNMELNETSAQRVSDVYSQLAAITASDVNEISNAMTKTASIASSAGMEFETTAAFLSQIIETTRESAETAGTAMKTVIARFQELKKDPSEIGEVDGEIVDANAIETALRSVGVSLRDTNGQFRELDDVFLELSSKWSSLDKNTQRYIATIAAGSRQQSRFIAMMSDYSRTQQLVTEANNSAGASAKQFEKTQDSLASKMERLKNAWHEFTMGIMSSDLVKFGVDALTKFLEIINKATSALDGVGGSITKLGAVLSIFKIGKSLFSKIPEGFKKAMVDVIRIAVDGGEKAAEGAAQGAQQAKNKIAQASKTETATQGFGQSVKNTFTKEGMKQAGASIKSAGLSMTGITDMVTGGKNLLFGGKQARNVLAEDRFKGKTREDLQAEIQKAEAQKSQYSKGSKGYYKQGQKGSIKKSEYDAGIAAADNNIKEAEQNLKDYDQAQANVINHSKDGWKQLSEGIGKASMAISGAGLLVTGLGQAFIDAGAEEFGESMQKVGSIMTAVGTAGSVLSTVMSILSAIFPAAGAAGAASGTATSAAWSPVTIIVLAIVAALALFLVGFLLIASAIKKNSPEEKLKKAEEAANAAAEAADTAAESYNKLADAFDSLGSKYDALNELVRGTKEWNEAVQDINSSVLDLIDQYPELAKFVKNVDGVMTIDVNSKEVQDVLNSYEKNSVKAKGAELAAKADVSAAKRGVNFSELDAVGDVANKRGWETGGSVAGGLGTYGAMIGMIGGPIGMAIGAGVGAIAGAIAGPIDAAATKTDAELQEATENLAASIEQGETELNFDAMQDFLIEQGVAADEAKIMAQSFAENTDELREFGQSTLAARAAEESYYNAMAMNAQQMLSMEYGDDEKAQMLEAVDNERIKAIEEAEKKAFEDMSKEDKKKAKEEYAKSVYGEDAKVDGNKIIYYDAEGNKQEKELDEETWKNQIAAANATEKAAEAMEKVPDMIDKAAEILGGKGENGKASIVEKALTNSEKLTKEELDQFKEAVGGTTTDENGKEIINSAEGSELKALWDGENHEELEAIYGDYETFIKEYQDVIDKQNKAWDGIEKKAEKLGFNADENGKNVISNMSAQAANTWTNLIEDVFPAGTEEGADELNEKLNAFITGMSQEEVDSVMAQIGAIDKMDSQAWDKLAYTFEELGLVADASDEQLQEFIDAAKETTGAILKIDFSNFNNQISQTISLLKKAEEGNRKYSEDDYKSFISASPELKDDFAQIGDEFVYIGTSMNDLTDALKENTMAKLEEANFVLGAQLGMSNILNDKSKVSSINTTNATEGEERQWLLNTVSAFAQEDYDVKNLGIEGLSLNTDFSKLSEEQTTEMIKQIFEKIGKTEVLESQQNKQMRDANIATYTIDNSAVFNATQGISRDADQADEHRAALIAQAVDAGVSDIMIERYKNAETKYLAGGNEADFRAVTQELLDMMAAKESEATQAAEVDAYAPLAQKVADAIEKQRQDEIDKLSEVNESINSANNMLLNKIQEQINQQRQDRENQRMKDDLSNMYSQQAYLAMDTSGANATQMLDNEQAIEDAEQEYRDALIDQALQQLQDANEKAAEQRERQITLMQQQLDYERDSGMIADEAAQVVRESIDQMASGTAQSATKLYEYLNASLENLGGFDREQTRTEWAGLITSAIEGADRKYNEENQEDSEDYSNPNGNNSANGSGKSEGLGTDNLTDEQEVLNKQTAISNKKQSDAANVTLGETVKAAEAMGIKYTQDEHYKKLEEAENEAKVNELGTYSETLNQKIQEKISGYRPIAMGKRSGWNNGANKLFDVTLGDTKFQYVKTGNAVSDDKQKELDAIMRYYKETLGNGNIHIVSDRSTAYIRDREGQTWYPIEQDGDSKKSNEQWSKFKEAIKFKTGGLADFTGPAWLDGTKSRPEYVLNSAQTEKFFSLIDVLERYDSDKENSKKSGDSYFDININVEKLENDYDVEQMADKIRRMIYDDATYRNVNAINHIR